MVEEQDRSQAGFTLVELVISLAVLAMVSVSILGLFTTLVRSAIQMKRRSVALTIATNQMEYLRGLPYNNLAVQGGSIVATNPLPATTTQTIDNYQYSLKTSVNYLDDAFDGCGNYPNQQLKETYCRNYGFTNNGVLDQNPADYKSVNVKVLDPSGGILSEIDTQIAARVAETNNNTGGMFITVLDDNGDPLHGATVQVVNTTTSPAVNVSDTTDQNGNAVFYSLPPDPLNYDYSITASLTGYSTLATIAPSGSLQPNYSNQRVIAQQSSLLTMNLRPQGTNSLAIEATDTAGNPINNLKLYLKGGYKKYNSVTDTSYYYDTMSPTDTRVTTDASGHATATNLVPGDYYFCGNAGATSCSIGGTTYYLAAAIPYGGVQSFGPLNIPTYVATSPPPTFTLNGTEYLQKVRLILTTSSTFPRVSTVNPDSASISTSTMSALHFAVTGANLPCTSNPASCNTSVTILQGANTYAADCTGTSGGTQLDCIVDLSTAIEGATQLRIVASSQTLTIPSTLSLGGITIAP